MAKRVHRRPPPEAPAGSRAAGPARRLPLLAALLVVGIAAAYAPLWHAGFINYDDPAYVTRNPHVETGVTPENVLWALTSVHSGNWHPLTSLSHMLDVEVFGLRPAAHHLVSLAIHALDALLLLLLFRRMTGDVLRSALVAFLFGLHPLHVESVAWVAERKDVLSALLWFLTTWAYVRYAERPSRARYAAVAALFALGLLAKPMLVTLPLTLLLLDVWPLGRLRLGGPGSAESPSASPRTAGALVVEKLPLLLLSAISSAITLAVQSRAGAIAPIDRLPLATRAANAVVSCATYLAKAVWPSKLAVFYPFDEALPPWEIAAAGAAVAGTTVLAIALARRAPPLLVGWLWYLVTLLPVIGIVQVGNQARADRYTYLPLIGIFVMLAWGAPALAGDEPRRRRALAVLATAGVAACAALTYRQAGFWRSDETLYEHALAVTRENAFLHYNLAHAVSRRGELERAERHYAEAARIKPTWFDAQFNLGNTLAKEGKLEEAAAIYERAIRASPGDADGHNGLGAVLMRLGRRDEALLRFEEAIRLRPEFPEAHNNLAVLEAERGNDEAAIAHYREALRLKPDYEKAREGLERLVAPRPR